MGRFNQAELAQRIAAATGHSVGDELGCFSDPIQAVVEDVERIKNSPFLVHRDKVRGFMYDLFANRLNEVSAGVK